MRRWILIMILFFPLKGMTQKLGGEKAIQENISVSTAYYLNSFLQIDNIVVSQDKPLSLIKNLERKRSIYKNDRDFLNYLFIKTHQKVLKRYTQYCTFSSLINSGTYNCLTGTALYAILLDHFNFDYNIIETNYHIFLIAKTSKGEVLFEATDPLGGFISSTVEIEKRISVYRANEIEKCNGNKKNYQYSFSLYHTVDLEQLLGLLYYNYSIEAYNQNRYVASINYLEKATRYYNTERLEEFSKIILLTVMERKINVAEREFCLRKLQSLRSKMPVMVSLNQ